MATVYSAANAARAAGTAVDAEPVQNRPPPTPPMGVPLSSPTSVRCRAVCRSHLTTRVRRARQPSSHITGAARLLIRGALVIRGALGVGGSTGVQIGRAHV